ncbi:MAG: hypothetical protein ACNS62_16770 [Candidatus Cyclobacteriaceae bacterium M3_2C_046]
MKLTQYKILPKEEQANYVFLNGVFLCHIDYQNTTRALYSIQNFYVEVIHDRSNNQWTEINPFTELDYLNPYLERIQLNFNIRSK